MKSTCTLSSKSKKKKKNDDQISNLLNEKLKKKERMFLLKRFTFIFLRYVIMV